MLRKLMKHEFRATSRIMLPLFLLVLVTAVGANLSIRKLTDEGNRLLETLGVLLVVAFAVAIAGVCIVAFGLMIQRFYKNLLQDEGYVMMTLPVSVHQHVWSKLLVSVVWYAATAVVVVLASGILVFDLRAVEQMLAGVGELLSNLRIGYEAVNVAAVIVECVVLLFLAGIGLCLQFYAAMAIGHSFASHKMVLSVAAYFGLQFMLRLVTGAFFMVMDMTGLDYALTPMLPRLTGAAAFHGVMLLMIGVSALFAGVFYFLTTWFLKHRLNLE